MIVKTAQATNDPLYSEYEGLLRRRAGEWKHCSVWSPWQRERFHLTQCCGLVCIVDGNIIRHGEQIKVPFIRGVFAQVNKIHILEYRMGDNNCSVIVATGKVLLRYHFELIFPTKIYVHILGKWQPERLFYLFTTTNKSYATQLINIESNILRRIHTYKGQTYR